MPMAIGRPKAKLALSAEEQAQLALGAAAGESNSAIARRLSWSLPTVGKWRRRFVERRRPAR
jgi:putative transposase